MQADIQTAYETHQMKMAEIEAGLRAKVAETQISLEADLLLEQAQASSNIQQTQATVEGEIQKDVIEHEINMDAERAKTNNKLDEIAASAIADIQKEAAKPTAEGGGSGHRRLAPRNKVLTKRNLTIILIEFW